MEVPGLLGSANRTAPRRMRGVSRTCPSSCPEAQLSRGLLGALPPFTKVLIEEPGLRRLSVAQSIVAVARCSPETILARRRRGLYLAVATGTRGSPSRRGIRSDHIPA
jgi:hypothetical protein